MWYHKRSKGVVGANMRYDSQHTNDLILAPLKRQDLSDGLDFSPKGKSFLLLTPKAKQTKEER